MHTIALVTNGYLASSFPELFSAEESYGLLVWKMLNKARALAVIYPVHQWRYGTHKFILASHNVKVKVAQKPFQTVGYIFSKPKDPVSRE